MSRLALVALLAIALPAHAADPAQPAAPAAAPTDAPPRAAAVPAAQVARAQFTTQVQNNEPTDNVTVLTNDQTRVLFYTELRELAGQTVTHRWEYQGKVVSEVPLEVGAARWRTYSSKTLGPSQTGDWKASVVDASGNTLGASTFTYQTGGAAPTTPAAPPQP
jgi:hypothetical protein